MKKFDEVLIQANVLLITLLFVVAQISEKPALFAASLAYIAALFTLSAIAATFSMFEDLGEDWAFEPKSTLFIRGIEITAFLMGLMILFAMFCIWSWQLPEYGRSIVVGVGASLLVPILLVVQKHRKERRGRAAKGYGT